MENESSGFKPSVIDKCEIADLGNLKTTGLCNDHQLLFPRVVSFCRYENIENYWYMNAQILLGQFVGLLRHANMEELIIE